MKSPRSAFPTWSTYIPDVGPAPSTGSANYAGIGATLYRSRGGGMMRSAGDLTRAAGIAAQQLSTAAGVGRDVVQQSARRPILTAIERNRARWDPAADLGDQPHSRYPGQVQGPPNLPSDYGSRVGWFPEEPQAAPEPEQQGPWRHGVYTRGILSPLGGADDPQNFDLAAFQAEEEAAGRPGIRRGRSASHGNAAAADTAQGVRQAIGNAAAAVIKSPNRGRTTSIFRPTRS